MALLLLLLTIAKGHPELLLLLLLLISDHPELLLLLLIEKFSIDQLCKQCGIINNDVIKGFSNENHHIFNDRKEALKFALRNLKSDEILIIFGKGTEEYQEINGTKHFYSDSNIIKEFYEN